MSVERLNIAVICGQRELRDFDEGWTMTQYEEYSNGVLIRLNRDSYSLKNRPDIVEFIGQLIEDENWKEVLVDWSW
jgi:hypothetical protein